MNVSGLGISNSITQNLQQAEIKVTQALNSSQASSTSSTQDSVTISEEGQKKLSSELGATLFKNAKEAQSDPETQEAQQKDNRTELEKQIDDLKEKIKELQAERKKLSGDNSEAAIEQRKLIDNQINILNAQLINLLKKQQDQAKSA